MNDTSKKTRQRKPPKFWEHVITRRDAASAFDRIRYLLAQRIAPEKIEEIISNEYNIPAPKQCNGEAHSNPHIDNCGVCMHFHWGFSGKSIKIT